MPEQPLPIDHDSAEPTAVPLAGPTALPMALPAWLAIALVAGTSATVLVLEILAGRLLAPYVGVSLETYTGIIGTILVGIAVGAWAGGMMADRVNPRRLLPPLLLLGGALAIATIPVVRIVGSASRESGSGLWILVLAALGFLPAATVLSAVPPAVIKLQLRDLAATGTTVGRLSAWSTGGAIFGTFFTGFFLVAAAPVSTLIVTIGLVLVVAGGALWWFGRREGFVVGASQLFSAAGLATLGLVGTAAIASPCDTQTSYYCLSVVVDDDRPRGRTLVLDDLRHSYIDLDDPTHLEFWYIRRLADVIALAPRDDVVFLGGGALTLPRHLRATSPGTQQIVFEIDDGLIDVVEAEFGYRSSASIDVRIGDARVGLVGVTTDSADVVIGDAFGSRSVPFHLATEEFIRDVRRVLRPAGIYAVNVIDSAGRYFLKAQAATLGRVFEHVVVVLGPAAAAGHGGNSVIVASDVPIDALALDQRRADVGDGGEVVSDPADLIAGAPILTDDFAPVDQLIASG